MDLAALVTVATVEGQARPRHLEGAPARLERAVRSRSVEAHQLARAVDQLARTETTSTDQLARLARLRSGDRAADLRLVASCLSAPQAPVEEIVADLPADLAEREARYWTSKQPPRRVLEALARRPEPQVRFELLTGRRCDPDVRAQLWWRDFPTASLSQRSHLLRAARGFDGATIEALRRAASGITLEDQHATAEQVFAGIDRHHELCQAADWFVATAPGKELGAIDALAGTSVHLAPDKAVWLVEALAARLARPDVQLAAARIDKALRTTPLAARAVTARYADDPAAIELAIDRTDPNEGRSSLVTLALARPEMRGPLEKCLPLTGVSDRLELARRAQGDVAFSAMLFGAEGSTRDALELLSIAEDPAAVLDAYLERCTSPLSTEVCERVLRAPACASRHIEALPFPVFFAELGPAQHSAKAARYLYERLGELAGGDELFPVVSHEFTGTIGELLEVVKVTLA